MTETGADLATIATGEVLEILTQGSDEQFVELLGQLEVDEIADVGLALTVLSKGSSIRAGRAAYEIRTSTPDGEWGREVYKLATLWEVSERTIHRWMSAAQEHFGFELTPAQRNAQAPAAADAPPAGGPAWEEDDDPESAGFWKAEEDHVDGEGGHYGWDPQQMADVWIPDEESDIIDQRRAFEDLIGEPWAERDSVTPSPEYTNVMPGSFTPTPLLLEPDETWVAFTASQIQQEHPAFGDEAARRNATARWARKLETEPLDLLEELEMIHGGSVPDEVASKLIEAEEHKVVVPDEVTEGGSKKGKRGPAAPKGLPAVADKLMEMSRELHGRIHAGVQEGTVPDAEIASLEASVMGAAHTVEGLKKMVNQAKDRLRRAEKMASSGATEF